MKVSILWGFWPKDGQKAVTYSFKTQGELDAFLLGVDKGHGWGHYVLVKEGYVYKEGKE
jgi:hypothetical protein